MAIMKIKLPTFECLRCDHKWHPEKQEEPKVCAFCKSPYYKSVSMRGASPQRLRHARECNAPQCQNGH